MQMMQVRLLLLVPNLLMDNRAHACYDDLYNWHAAATVVCMPAALAPCLTRPRPYGDVGGSIQQYLAASAVLLQGQALAAANAAATSAAGQGLMAGSCSGLSREQKAKLLWGAKKDKAAAGVAPAFGSNRWEAAEFDDSYQKAKFQRLMGAHPQQQQQQQRLYDAAAHDEDMAQTPQVMKKEGQQRVLRDVEMQFIAGLRRADGRTAGLGM
jgi:collagen type VII alpha